MQTLPLQPGTTITEDTRVPPGKYFLPDPEGEGAVRILADGVLLDLTGVELIGAEPSATPDTYSGLGIVAHGRQKLTIRGGNDSRLQNRHLPTRSRWVHRRGLRPERQLRDAAQKHAGG
ncbi:MAG: hypothetical protein KatS3mg115_2350 [Candidatus Poribacteria bacterium]|nr:MAG: hypothetical protein KatS3mg115_2350 [Candidatus Poribacteria bacterium]